MMLVAMKIVYIANIIVAGWIGVSSTFYPKTAAATVFQNAYQSTEVMRLVGCLWLSIAILSILGLWKPISFSPIFLVQLLYKGTWLVVIALPAFRANQPYPRGMAVFFVIWVLILPFIMPWSVWVNSAD
ncbi:MAG: hypothetical protein EAZ92_15620 [Candidatus Kapaibacterium sp.]|nr:MAG: hypothetical protein EAZ92_15620 [Candidatus Kapabacteria bacterium]